MSVATTHRLAIDDALPTGVGGLDDILGGGYARRHIHLIEGEPGAGKTTFAPQFLLDGAARGERGLYITLTESREELLHTARGHGWSFDGIEIYELIPRATVVPRYICWQGAPRSTCC